MRKSRFSLNGLIYNNRMVVILSLILSVVIWVFVSIKVSPPQERVIRDVPVKIEMSASVEAFDLQLFGRKDFKVDVTVVGKRYVVAERLLSADDLIVTASTNYVDSAGKYTLRIDAKKKSADAEFEIIKLSYEYVDVFFDYYKEGEYTLTPEIVFDGELVLDGYFKDKEILSAKTVKISGPATEIQKIDKVFARVTLKNVLTSTQTLDAEILPVGELGGTLRYLTINNDNADISMTIPVYKVAELPAAVTFKNIPPAFITTPLKYGITPQNAVFGIDAVQHESIKEVSVKTIDFADLKPGMNTFTVKNEDIKNAKVLEKADGFKITVDLKSVTSKSFNIPAENVILKNVNPANAAELANKTAKRITVVGPADRLAELTPEDLTVEIDLENIQHDVGNVSVPAIVALKNNDNCWVSGHYNYDVKFTK